MMQINGMSGAVDLAASNVCAAGKTFVNKGAAEDVIYLYTYETGVPAAVTFTAGENGTMSANGCFILYDDFTCGSAEEIQSFLSRYYGVSVKVSEVEWR